MLARSFHPLSGIFPLMTDSELDVLAEDIATHGLSMPIVIDTAGMIVDGRNRYLALQQLAYDEEEEYYTTTTLLGNELVAYVISLNLHRRHLNESQRAMVASKLAALGKGNPTGANQYTVQNHEETTQGGNRPIGLFPPPTLRVNESQRGNPQICGFPLKEKDVSIPYVTQPQAAELLNVSEGSLQTATALRRDAIPSLVEAVEQGEVAVSTAAEVARLPVPEQEEIVARGEKAILEAARQIRAEKAHRTKFTGENEWYTPEEYINFVREALVAIDLDPASSELAQETVQAGAYFSLDNDALDQPWHGRVFLNPPYSQPLISQFIDKLLAEIALGTVGAAITLTHNYTDTAWFQKLAQAATAVCFTRGRVRFISALGEIAAPTQGQAFCYFGTDVDRFLSAFATVGVVMEVRR